MSSHSRASSRLFLSADLVGSTARKQARGSDTWIGDVLGFYQQFPSHLSASVEDATTAKRDAIGFHHALDVEPELWKAVGDELIYTAEVTNEHQVCLLVDAWIAAMRSTERAVLDKAGTGPKGMDLKGAAWIATFPVPDRVVAVPLDPDAYDSDLEPEVVNRELLGLYDDGDRSTVRVDYLGPSVDIGFRVASRSVARKFMLAFEVAWAIAASRGTAQDSTPMYFEGEVELKGVWEGRGYPLFWLDTGNHHATRRMLDKIGTLDAVNPSDVRELAKAIRAGGDWPCKLYLPDGLPEFQHDHPEIDAAASLLDEATDSSGDIIELPGPVEP